MHPHILVNTAFIFSNILLISHIVGNDFLLFTLLFFVLLLLLLFLFLKLDSSLLRLPLLRKKKRDQPPHTCKSFNTQLQNVKHFYYHLQHCILIVFVLQCSRNSLLFFGIFFFILSYFVQTINTHSMVFRLFCVKCFLFISISFVNILTVQLTCNVIHLMLCKILSLKIEEIDWFLTSIQQILIGNYSFYWF